MSLSTYMYENQYTQEFLQFAKVNYGKEMSAQISLIDNGVILPLKKALHGGPLMGMGGVVDSDGNYVIESAQIGKGDTVDRFVGKYEYERTEEEYYDETVIYIGALPPHWGHFLIDMTYRFWFLVNDTSSYKVVYCSEENEFEGVYLEFMLLLGIEEGRLLRISKPSKFKQILVPHPSYMACDFYIKEFGVVFENLAECVKDRKFEKYDKIYLSRLHFDEANKKEIGEKILERNFAANGYKVIYMEEHSLAEQIYLINHAKKIVALSGTLCHNVVFADKEAELIILNKVHFINTHQVLINQMKGIKVVYIDVYREPFQYFPRSYGEGPFLLCNGKLKLFFKERGMVYKEEKLYKKIYNFVIYVLMCFIVLGKEMYENMYYFICQYPLIINFFRKMKDICIKGDK